METIIRGTAQGIRMGLMLAMRTFANTPSKWCVVAMSVRDRSPSLGDYCRS